MYRIKVLTSGEHIYTALGYRYCLRKKDAINLINDYVKENNCEITLEKFVRIYSTIFCWANDDANDKVFEYYNNLFE